MQLAKLDKIKKYYGDRLILDIKDFEVFEGDRIGMAQNGKVQNLILTHFSTAMNDPKLYVHNAKEVFNNTIIGFDRYKATLNFQLEYNELSMI